MNIFLIIIASVLGYAFMGGVIGARHHAIASRDCSQHDHFGSYWCHHVYMSVWFYGAAWWVALPMTAGFLIGSSGKVSRTEKRHAKELAEAKHHAELARIKREEDEELDRQLSNVRKSQ